MGKYEVLETATTRKEIIRDLLPHNLHIEINQLITYGGSLLNRDGNGDQKHLIVGGTKRDSISSQCRKAAIRDAILDEKVFSTRHIASWVRNTAKKKNPELSEEYLTQLVYFVCLLFGAEVKKDKKSGKYPVTIKNVVCMGENEVEKLTDEILSNYPDSLPIKNEKDSYKLIDDEKIEQLKKEISMSFINYDIALFGRMVTSGIIHSIDSAASYNFAFSTNASNDDSDYFTARDTYANFLQGLELTDFDNQGSAHLNTRDVNSNTFYEYSEFNLGIYLENCLIGLSAEAIIDENKVKCRFKEAIDHLIDAIEATVLESPSAMQHQMASKPLPDCTYITLKEGRPITFESAFEKPVYASENRSVAEKSIQKLVEAINDDTYEVGRYLKKYWISKTNTEIPIESEQMKFNDTLNDLKGYLYDMFEIGD